MLKKTYDLLHDIWHHTVAKILLFSPKNLLAFDTGIDEVRWLNSEIKNYMIQLKQNLENIFNKENLL